MVRYRLRFCVLSGLVKGWWSKLRAAPSYPTQIWVPPLGFPQGTLDGPTYFLALANDSAIKEDSNKIALKYVNDFTMVENIHISQQSELDCNINPYQWATDPANFSAKCMFMDITFAKEPPVHELKNTHDHACDYHKLYWVGGPGDLRAHRATK